ncbi:MAG TPA: hypothetical protein VJ860_13250 [Polyangia bacterium]|jgi:hypothetical protein|nr:hypothetical protein [Polyangia bacterium]
MMPKVGVFACSVTALTSLCWAGCGSDAPLCAQVGQQIPLTASPLSLTRDTSLVRAGEGFVLAGLDGSTVRWGQLSSDGQINGESAFDLPEQPATTAGGQSLGPLFAVTSKTVPGDQLVVVMGVLQAGTTDNYEVHVGVHDLGSTVPPVMQTLGVQAAAPTSGPIRLVAGSSPSGTRALVLWGVEGQRAPIRYQMLGADGALVGNQGTIDDDSDPNNIPPWSCLGTTQNNAATLAVTLVEAPSHYHLDRYAWRHFKINDDGAITGIDEIDMDALTVSDCRILSTATSDGYLVAWQDNTATGGTSFAVLTAPPPDAGPGISGTVTTKSLLASALYGGYSNMPKLAWIAPAGFEFTVGLARPQGPEVVRFDDVADPRGKALYLPSVSGNTGSVSAWVGSDAVYVTYLDIAGSSRQADAAVPAGSQRLLVTVLSPAELP